MAVTFPSPGFMESIKASSCVSYGYHPTNLPTNESTYQPMSYGSYLPVVVVLSLVDTQPANQPDPGCVPSITKEPIGVATLQHQFRGEGVAAHVRSVHLAAAPV